MTAITATSQLAKQQAAFDSTKTLPTQAADGTAIATGKQSATAALSGNYETFIKLLTSQLKNQDPLQPTDSAAFTQQLVQYSQVEQQISTNGKLDSILSGITGQSATQYVNYIGKNVSVSGEQLQLTGGAANIGYTLPDTAKSVSIDILDKANNVVATFAGDTKLGAHSYTWDGTLKDGSTVTSGTYKFKVSALGADGNALTNVTQSYTGKVTGVKSGTGGAVLDLGGFTVSPGDVSGISL